MLIIYLCIQNQYTMRNKFLYIVFTALLLTGCTTRPEKYVIGMSQCLDDAWRENMNDEMDCELLLHPMITLNRRIAYGDSERQCAQIDSFISERVDVLIVSPNDAESVRPAISRAYKAGIPVVVADRRISGDDWTAFIGGDNYGIGRLMAQWAVSKDAKSVLEVTGLPNSQAETQRHQGFIDGIKEARESGHKISIAAIAGHIDAYTAVMAYASDHSDIDVIVAHNDMMAVEASRAVQTANDNSSIPIMGVDGIEIGLQAIVDGRIECTALYPSRGDILIKTAVNIITGESFARDTILETMLIDASVAYPLLQQQIMRRHDLETMQWVRLQSSAQWKQANKEKVLLIAVIVVVILILLGALCYVIFSQRKMQTEIHSTILPQLEDVQDAIQVNRRDAAFVERIQQIVDEHLTDPNMNVELLAGMLFIDRTQLFRRVKTATGKGPSEFIRERRLLRADELLQTTDKTVREVALELCFSNPGYFSKYYKEYFGHLPSER